MQRVCLRLKRSGIHLVEHSRRREKRRKTTSAFTHISQTETTTANPTMAALSRRTKKLLKKILAHPGSMRATFVFKMVLGASLKRAGKWHRRVKL
jgi:hypothetical protein